MRPLMLTSNSNSPAILDNCQKRLKSSDSSLQKTIRFSALATAFLGSNGQVYGNVRISGGELYTRKAALIYFLTRVAEKTSVKKIATREDKNDVVTSYFKDSIVFKIISL